MPFCSQRWLVKLATNAYCIHILVFLPAAANGAGNSAAFRFVTSVVPASNLTWLVKLSVTLRTPLSNVEQPKTVNERIDVGKPKGEPTPVHRFVSPHVSCDIVTRL